MNKPLEIALTIILVPACAGPVFGNSQSAEEWELIMGDPATCIHSSSGKRLFRYPAQCVTSDQLSSTIIRFRNLRGLG